MRFLSKRRHRTCYAHPAAPIQGPRRAASLASPGAATATSPDLVPTTGSQAARQRPFAFCTRARASAGGAV
eukprot:7707750-Alexandrium_andersonii.AAC.1